MSDYTDSLIRIRDLAVERLEEALANPKPSYNVDGQNFKWTAYQDMLKGQIKDVNDMLREEEQKSTPYEITSTAYTDYSDC